MEDELLLELLDLCSDYAKEQENIGTQIANGLFELTKSKRSGGGYTSASDCRYDLDACTLVDGNELLSVKSQSEAILLVSALPSPSMRAAQKKFFAALQAAVRLVKIKEKINSQFLGTSSEIASVVAEE